MPPYYVKRLEKLAGQRIGEFKINDVLLSGGDPLSLSDDTLDWILSKLSNVPHVKTLRIGSRYPVTLPQRITPELIKVLKKYKKPRLDVQTHFNHPWEITGESSRAVSFLVENGIRVFNQTVLMRNVNDDVKTMKELCEGIDALGVIPYYLYQADMEKGTDYLRTSVWKGLWIMEKLRDQIPGHALPVYILVAPRGKLHLPEGIKEYRLNEGIVKVEGFEKKFWIYRDPKDYPKPTIELEELKDILNSKLKI